MGGEINWNALPVLVDVYGIADMEMFLAELVAIRDHFRRLKDA